MTRLAALLLFSLAATANAEGLRLILVPQQNYIEQGRASKFDIFLYNDTNKPRKVPSLESFIATYTLRSTTPEQEPVVHSGGRVVDHPDKDHTLQPKRVDHLTVDIPIDVTTCNVVEVQVEVGEKSPLKSNSVLLFCRSPKNESQQR